MKNQIKHIVVLHPDAIKHFEPLIDAVVSEVGVIRCSSMSQEMHFLEIDALPRVSDDAKVSFHLSIPYSFVLYIATSSSSNLNKILGFHADAKKDGPPTGS